MNKIPLLVLLITLCASAFSMQYSLYPEDGSVEMNYWYYSGGQSGPQIKKEVIEDIEKAFRSEGVEPVVFANYSWMQDILFFDEVGNFVELANLPLNEEYYDGLTMGVFESFGWGSAELTRVSGDDFFPYDKKVKSLSLAFLEGGATITGKFANGESYLIAYESRFNGMAKAYRDLMSNSADTEEIHNYLANDLNVKPENLIFIPTKAGSEHLDLFMKALPGGVILIDDPSRRVEVASSALKNSSSNTLNNIMAYEEGDNYSWQKNNYKKKINLVTSLLEKKFKIISITGRFFEYFTNVNGVTTGQELINFFNGVSGVNKQGNPFYITNMAENDPELEDYWSKELSVLGFDSKNIHYPGEYSNGSGLDCMGSPTI